MGLANNPYLKPNPKPNLNLDQVLEYDGAELDDLASELEAELEVTVMRKKELNGALLPLTLTVTLTLTLILTLILTLTLPLPQP